MSEHGNQRPALGSAIAYKDPMAAIKWLEEALGFQTTLLITDGEGNLAHSELSFGNGYVMVANEWAENIKSPRSVGNANTQTIHVQLEREIDAHCERARAHGAVILQEPQDQFYGDRTYRLLDPEGHMWTFGQTVRSVSNQEMEAATGLKFQVG